MEKLKEAIGYIMVHVMEYTVPLCIVFILISLLGFSYKKAYTFFKKFPTWLLVVLIPICYCIVFGILIKNIDSSLWGVISCIITFLLLNVCGLSILISTKTLIGEIFELKKCKHIIRISVICLLLIFLSYKFLQWFLLLIIWLSIFIVINSIRIYKEKNRDNKQNDINEKLTHIINNEVNGNYINKLRKNLGKSKAEDIYEYLSKTHISSLIKLKYVLKKDIEDRKIKFPIKQTLIFLFSGIGGLSTLAGTENTINFISDHKNDIAIVLSFICSYIFLYWINIYSSILNQNKSIGTDYLLLLIDNVIESNKEKLKEGKEKKDAAITITENNVTTETEILEIDEREGVLKIKIENKKAPVNNTSAEK